MSSGKDIKVYEFGPFRLDPLDRRLLRGGRPIPLPAKVFDLLLLLVQHGGRLVEKATLIESVWPDSFVEEHNLTVSISMLRKALGENQGEHQYIETVPRRGYRFVAPVRQNCAEGTEALEHWSRGEWEKRINAGEDVSHSLAVLPLENISTDPDLEYLSDGITESIINSLAQLPTLRVMARNIVFRYKGQNLNAQEIGRELHVEAVLMGRLLQLGPTLIIRTELINVADGSQIWGEQYNRQFSDILIVQDEIAQTISEKLRLKLRSGERRRLTKRYTQDTEAYQLYLRGRYFWNKCTKEGITKGIKYFQQAIEMDQNYALAYAGLADSYFRLSNVFVPPRWALPKAQIAASRAIEIDDALFEAHLSQAMVKLYYEHDWAGAEREYQKALELNPGSAQSHYKYGMYLTYMGRFDEAKEEIVIALKLDPLSLQAQMSLGTNLYAMRRHHQASKQYKKALELEPDFVPARFALGCNYIHLNRFDEAIAELQKAIQLAKDSSLALGFLGYAYAMSNQTDKAKKVIGQLKEHSKQKYISPYSIAIIYAGLGQKKKAFVWLEKTYADQNDWLVWLKVSPEWESLRSEAQFEDLLLRIGFTTQS
jgi:DNA-binding winged helix-turn-helix (wHTH) protein/Tfp pilus assembly protein PilF